MIRHIVPCVLATSFAVTLATESTARLSARQDAITVSGCVERDAAARTTVYKLVTKAANGSQIYRLSGGDVAPHLGHTIEVTGAVTKGDRDQSIAVKTIKMVSDHCD